MLVARSKGKLTWNVKVGAVEVARIMYTALPTLWEVADDLSVGGRRQQEDCQDCGTSHGGGSRRDGRIGDLLRCLYISFSPEATIAMPGIDIHDPCRVQAEDMWYKAVATSDGKVWRRWLS
jgi:hypothetical protein